MALLLRAPRVDITAPRNDGVSPFLAALENGNDDVVRLMVREPRVDVNAMNTEHTTPLWYGAQNGHTISVQYLLASDHLVDTKVVSLFNDRNAADQARAMGKRVKRGADTEVDHRRKVTNGPLLASLIEEYEVNPVATRWKLRCLPILRGEIPST